MALAGFVRARLLRRRAIMRIGRFNRFSVTLRGDYQRVFCFAKPLRTRFQAKI
tara:strand:+ start:7386 stop:7544 length:159 start_codon:yes stop_codon:yes gene_type:complete